MQQHIKNMVTIAVVSASIFFMGISGLLIFEYRYFCKQADKMIALQEDYRNYVVAVKKILTDYNKTSDRLKYLEAHTENEKKNAMLELTYFVDAPGSVEGTRIFSSDDDEATHFVPLNREYEYLKQSMLDYFKEQNLDQLIRQLNHDEWIGYTDLVLERHRVQGQRVMKKAESKKKQGPLFSRVQTPKVTDIHFSLPIARSSFWLSSLFGPRKKANGMWGFHYGIDMAAAKGTPVYTAASGVVVEARYSSGYGKTIVVAHNKKYRTRYAHLDKILVRVGQKVDRAQLIGRVGATGFVRKSGNDASHLHFEVYVYGKKANPLYFLST